MSEPLDLGPIRERLYVTGWQNDLGRIDDFDALVAEVERLRTELARRVEQVAAVQVVMDEWHNVGDPIYMDDAANEIDAALDGTA